MTSRIIVNNIQSDAGVSTVFFNSDIGGTSGTLNVDGNLNVGGVVTYDDVTNIDSVGVITARSDVSIADKIVHTGDTNTAIRFPAADTVTVETGGKEALRIGSDQKVYFGDFASAGSKAYIEKEVSGDYKLNIHASSSTAQNRIITFNSREDVESMRIDANGRVGISTAVPSYRLDIGDGANDPANGYQLRVNAGGDYIFALQRQSNASFSIRNNSTGIVHLNTQNNKILSLGVNSGNTSGSIADDVRIDSNGHLSIVDGNLVVANGHGIDFSAAGNAGGMQSELLDDYEEGTYSASITMGTSGTVTMNSSYDTLSYTKIGRMVYVTGQIRVSSVSSPVGGTRINLPFAVRNNISDARGGGTVTLFITGQAHYYWPLVYQIAESTSQINLTHNASGYFLPQAGNEYAISIMYIVS